MIGPARGQSGLVHWFGQPKPSVEADVHAEGIPRLQAHVTAADHRMFVVVIQVEALALFAHGAEPAALAGAAHSHRQARFQGAQHRNEARAHAVALGDVVHELLLADLTGTEERVRPLGGGRPRLGFVQEAASQ